jgi:hypothetical protein
MSVGVIIILNGRLQTKRFTGNFMYRRPKVGILNFQKKGFFNLNFFKCTRLACRRIVFAKRSEAEVEE